MNPANTPPVISRGRHEPFGNYLDRLDTRLTWGRHEVRTPGKGKFDYRGGPRDKYDETMIPPIELELRDALDAPDYEAGYKAWFWSDEDLDEEEAFELGVKVAIGLESPSTDANPHHHPSWSIKHCPYPDGHKPGCSWWSGSAWVETGITPDK